MGSKLSGFLSNLFLNELEISVIPKYYKNKKLLFFGRYVDDIIMIVKKDCYHEIHKEFNSYSENLKFTVEKMNENKINFLDITLELRDSKLHMWNYSKPQNRNKITDFKHEICPRSQKVGTLVAEIHRVNNTTNSTETLNFALETLRTKFIKNNYPIKLIDTKINEIKARNFQKSVSRKEYEEKFKNLDYTNFQNITLPFTDLKCGKIAFEIKNLIRKICPNFELNFSFTNIKLKNFVSPLLKPKISKELKSGLIYEFKCPCSESYIGETKQLLCYRVQQHRRDHDSHIFSHIQTCSQYQNMLSQKHPNSTLSEKRAFLLSFFSILENNITRTHLRKVCEANYINTKNPSLNKQVHHYNLSLMCSCLKKSEEAILEAVT